MFDLTKVIESGNKVKGQTVAGSKSLLFDLKDYSLTLCGKRDVRQIISFPFRNYFGFFFGGSFFLTFLVMPYGCPFDSTECVRFDTNFLKIQIEMLVGKLVHPKIRKCCIK